MPGTAHPAAEWGEDRDAFVTAIAELLAAGPHADPLTHPQTVLAARDRVVGEIQTLVGVLSQADPDPRPVTLHDLVERPAVALAGALRALATPAAFQQVAPSDPPPPHVSEYERRWQEAARRAAMLERHVDALRHLPSDPAGQVLTQLADVAAALVPLDTDLARACQATSGSQARAHLPALTDRAGHTALRLCASEVRVRPAATAGPVQQRQEPPPHRERTDALTCTCPPSRRSAQPRAVVLSDLGAAMSAVADGLGGGGSLLSVPELRAVAALVEIGAVHAATVLRRAALAVPGARDVADALLPLVDAASGLRRVPVRSLAPPRVELPALCGELRRQLSRLAAVANRLPHATDAADLHRLADPALAWATQAHPVTDALATAVRSSLDAGLLAVPTELYTRRGPALLWAPASRSAEPPRVLLHAHHLRVLAGAVPHAAPQAATQLTRTTTGPVALSAAAAAAGTAHASLVHALATRASDLGRVARESLAHPPPKQVPSTRLGPQ